MIGVPYERTVTPMVAATPTSALTIPTLKEVEPPTPQVRQRETNPYDEVVASMALDVKGYSKGRQFVVKGDELAKAHESAIRRAVKHLSADRIAKGETAVGVTLPKWRADKSGNITMTFALIPARVRNTKTDKVKTPA